MTTTQSKEAIYIELEVLLDTRLATLSRLDHQAAELIFHTSYQTRDSDWFEGVDMEAYQQLWKTRDRNTLLKAQPTAGLGMVRVLVEHLIQEAVQMNSPYSGAFKVVVNTYPYQLGVEELDVLGRALALRLGVRVPVELIRLSPAEMTPAHVRSHFRLLVMYDYDSWMSTHYDIDPNRDGIKGVSEKLLLNVTLFAPAIYFKKPPTDDEVKQAVKEVGHPLAMIETLGCSLIGLQLIDIAFFNAVRPTHRHTPPTQTNAHIEPLV